jgi:hypothetical protein
MRFLIVNNHCITNPTAGVAHSLRTIAMWLAEAGHSCHIVTTARFEGEVPFTIEQHLSAIGVRVGRRAGRSDAAAPIVRYRVGDVPTTLLMTRHNDQNAPDEQESEQYLALVDELLESMRPDQMIACGGHIMVRASMLRAQQGGVTTAYAVRGYGYDDRRVFEGVDHAFTCSDFLTEFYRTRVGLLSTPLEPPIDWSNTVSSSEARAFVTFVNPGWHKGLALFARLADMLGSRRPDIPILVVQSAHSAGMLHATGIDLTRYPHIKAAPPVLSPADYFALTRVLLVPSVWDEPFGRVAAEAMINGIPPLVSDRGALPHVVGGDVSRGGGGYVLPVPSWLNAATTTPPGEVEIEPWFRAVCELWDNPGRYQAVANRARAIAADRYSEAVSRKRHVDYFTSLRPGAPLFTDSADAPAAPRCSPPAPEESSPRSESRRSGPALRRGRTRRAAPSSRRTVHR